MERLFIITGWTGLIGGCLVEYLVSKSKRVCLVEFNDRLKKIDLIDNFYIQELNKDYALVKIKYLGKIEKIISKLKSQNINLQLIKGQWQLTEI